MGIYALLDPIITGAFDIARGNFENGDMFKIPNLYYDIYDSYAVGVFFVAIIYGITISLTFFLFQRWMIFHYMNGRILDLYRRLSAGFKDFFVPYDAEVSLKYLQWVINRAKRRNTVMMSERRLIKDKVGVTRTINFINILKITNGVLYRNRMFFKDFDGSIIEVPQRKSILRKRDLKRLARQGDKDNVNVYGDGAYTDLTTLIMNTHLVLEQGLGAQLLADPAQDG